MSLDLDTSQAAVMAVVAGVAGLEGIPVYNYMPHVTDVKEVRDLFVGTDERLHFWTVVPSPQEPLTIRRLMGCDQADPFNFDVHGIYALGDNGASKAVFVTLAYAVFEALRAAHHFTGDIGSGPPQWVENDERMFTSVLVHHVRFRFPIKAQLSP